MTKAKPFDISKREVWEAFKKVKAKDAPIHRAIQHVGRLISAPILGGLHHHYYRI